MKVTSVNTSNTLSHYQIPETTPNMPTIPTFLPSSQIIKKPTTGFLDKAITALKAKDAAQQETIDGLKKKLKELEIRPNLGLPNPSPKITISDTIPEPLKPLVLEKKTLEQKIAHQNYVITKLQAQIDQAEAEFAEKVSAAESKLVELAELDTEVQKMIASLKEELISLGVKPDASVAIHFGFIVSSSKEPLGGLETSIYQLNKKLQNHEAVVKKLEFQLAVTKAKKDLATLQALDQEQTAKLQALADGGIKVVGGPVREGVIISSKQAPLGELETQIFALAKKTRYQTSLLEKYAKALESYGIK